MVEQHNTANTDGTQSQSDGPSRLSASAILPGRDVEPRLVGIHGAGNTGKTCFLACVYGKRVTDEATITFPDDHSINTLKEAWDTLKKGGLPDANALTLPTELNFDLTAEKIGWRVQTRDYAGALVQRLETGADELVCEVKDWLKACSAILVFVNADEQDEDVLRERLNELNLLLTGLRSLGHDGNTIGRPLGLLLTKWDTQGPISDDPTTEKERARKFLQSHPVFGEISQTLEELGEDSRVDIFPVSAFGENREGKLPPLGGPKPFNLHAPFHWAVEKADDMLFDKAERKANRCVTSGKLWKGYGTAIKGYKDLEKKHGINKGPVYDKVQEELLSLRKKRRRRRMHIASVLAVVVAAGVTLGTYMVDTEGYSRALTLLSDDAVKPADVREACDDYVASPNPWSKALGRKADIKQKFREYQKNRVHADFRALEQYRKDHPDDEEAKQRLKLDQEFLLRWPSSEYAPTVNAWVTSDKHRYGVYLKNVRFGKALKELYAELSKLGGDYKQSADACGNFLATFTKEEYSERSVQIEEIEKKQKAYIMAEDEAAFKQLLDYARKHPTNYDEIIKRADKYTRTPGVRHSKEARDLISWAEVNWDWSEYNKVFVATRYARNNNANAIEAAERAARGYCSGPHSRKAGTAEVNKWIQWFQGFQKERNYYVTVKSVWIPDGSALSESLTTEEVQVTVDINSTVDKTKRGHYGRNPQIGERLGPFRFQWGKPGTLRVRVVEHDFSFLDPDDMAEGTVADDRFILGKTQGVFITTCSWGQNVIVTLECPEVVPPVLSQYPGR